MLLFFTSFSYGDELEQFSKQMTYFYLKPSESEFQSLQSKANKFEDQLKKASLLLAVMSVRINEKHGWPIQETFFSNTAKDILREESKLSQFVYDDSQVNPMKLDIWWVSFFATGEEQYLNNILQYAGEKAAKGDTGKLLVFSAATWSFKSNCNQHEKVREFAQKIITEGKFSPSKQALLNECVNTSE